MKDDADLLRAYVVERSEAAFAELLRRHLDLVYSAALRQVGGDAHLAEDVAQTVFVDLARKADQLTRHNSLTGWLYTAAHHAAAKAVRTEQRRRNREQEAHAMQEIMHNPTAAVDWDRLRPLLDTAMLELEDTEREAVLLRYFSDRSYPQIGRALSLSEEAARKRVDRAVERLRGSLGRRGLTATASALALVLSQHAVAAAPAGTAGAILGKVARDGAMATAVSTTTAQILLMNHLKTGLFAALALALASLLLFQQFSLRAAAVVEADMVLRASRLRADTFVANRRLAELQAAPAATPPLAEIFPPVPLSERPAPSESALVSMRVSLDDNFAPLFRRLRLETGELAQLRDLLVERAASDSDVQRMVGADFGTWSFAVQQELLVIGAEPTDAKIRALLGDERYGYFATYVRTLPWRSTFANYRLGTGSTSDGTYSPFTDEQIDQLAVWQAEAVPDRFGLGIHGGPAIADSVVSRATAILDTDQLEQLGKLQAANAAKDTSWRLKAQAETEWRAKLPGFAPAGGGR